MALQTSILIFGATRGTGLEAARALSSSGADVSAAVRETSDTTALKQTGATPFVTDVFDPASIDALFNQVQPGVVLISLSGQRGADQRPDREGAKLIIDAAVAHAVRRVLMVTAIGCGDSRSAVAPKVIEVLGEVLAAKTTAEDYLMAADLDATILRPGGLTDDPASGTAVMSNDHSLMGVANRADVGHLLAASVRNPDTVGGIYHVVDPEITWQAPLQRGEDVGAGN